MGAIVVDMRIGCGDGALVRIEFVGKRVGVKVGFDEGFGEGIGLGRSVGEAVGVSSTHCTIKDVPATAPCTHMPFADANEESIPPPPPFPAQFAFS